MSCLCRSRAFCSSAPAFSNAASAFHSSRSTDPKSKCFWTKLCSRAAAFFACSMAWSSFWIAGSIWDLRRASIACSSPATLPLAAATASLSRSQPGRVHGPGAGPSSVTVPRYADLQIHSPSFTVTVTVPRCCTLACEQPSASLCFQTASNCTPLATAFEPATGARALHVGLSSGGFSVQVAVGVPAGVVTTTV